MIPSQWYLLAYSHFAKSGDLVTLKENDIWAPKQGDILNLVFEHDTCYHVNYSDVLYCDWIRLSVCLVL